MASAAATAARTAVDKKVAAYTAPTAPATITHAALTKGEAKALSPVHPIGTVKEV